MNSLIQKYFLALFFIAFVGVAAFVVWTMISQQAATLHFQSTYALSPTPTPPGAAEPEVTSWKTYHNDKYNFALDMPADWHVQDYSAFFNNKGTLIAFSPTPLPCETCSYLHDGYFSVRIYNQQTDPQLYDIYKQNVAKLGNDANYRQVTIGSKPALLYGNIVTVENQGWLYEFSLDKDDGKADIMKATIFQRALTSFTFTSLFDN